MTLDVQYMIDPALIPIVEAASPGADTFDDAFAVSVRFKDSVLISFSIMEYGYEEGLPSATVPGGCCEKYNAVKKEKGV